jgi:hypothetical protein
MSTGSLPLQLDLCDDWLLGGGEDMANARRRLVDLQGAGRAPATVLAYATDWADFEPWCVGAGRASLPADPETVALYMSHLLPTHKVATLERRLAAIRSKHLEAGFPAPITPVLATGPYCCWASLLPSAVPIWWRSIWRTWMSQRIG